MRKVFLTTVCATAIGFSALTSARSQSAPVAPAANATKLPHLARTGVDAKARMKKPKIRTGVPVENVKRDDSWYKEMRDPCQVEG
jgi:hypothetical protein